MARVPKKTYSRKNCELHENEKENVDPFDELLSSPLKQEVQFKPLSFWGSNKKKSEPQKNLSKSKYKLFESDDSFSPNQGKKKTKRKTKRKSRKQGGKSVSGRSSNDCLKSDSFFKLEKYLKSPCSYKKTNAVKTSHINHVGYVTLRKPFRCVDVNIPVTPVENKGFALGGERRYDSSAEKLLNDCEWKQESGFDAVLGKTYIIDGDESTQGEEVERFLETPKEVCKSFTGYYIPVSELEKPWSDSLMNDSLELYQTTRESGLNGTEDFLDYSETISHGEVWLSTSLAFHETLGDKTIILPFETPELKDAEEESIIQSDSFLSDDVSDLTNLVSDMTISNETVKENTLGNSSSESFENESKSGLQSKALPVDDKKEDSHLYSDEGRNVTRRRPCRNPNPSEGVASDVRTVDSDKNLEAFTSTEIQENLKENEDESSDFSKSSLKVPKTLKSPDFKSEITFDSSRFSMFAPPIFESTRFIDDANDKEVSNNNVSEKERMTRRETVLPDEELSVVLKAGKKWQRSMSVLKQIQNGSFSADVNKVRGRRFEKFMQETLEMQTDNSYLSTSVSDMTISNGTLMNKTVNKESSVIIDRESGVFKSALDALSINEDEEDRTVLPFDEEKSKEVSESRSLSITVCNRTCMNRTVKVIPSCEPSLEKFSLFMSALGLQKDGSLIEVEESLVGETSLEEESRVISPRDFILLQCGQEDVLPFEEYFNERTLKNCKKIGEGVYGEVFMCNSDTVLKIIPIEGEDKVNGEPQKKFEEILSEVVIAANLSNLRNGDTHRTSGFSEMKRCWCVVGKYPKYLLDLWDEYDQSGSGSENDSPVMFKSDQLYIILELANGGKDLEAFVFNSSEQSLSIFIQTAFSLAVAEKAFEFEHRDLHWGNLLIAPTKEKFMTVVLDGIEYKIPTKGVKVSIIDFTLSRMSHEGCYIFNDLSVDPGLFTSQGDYQFEIYRMMQRELKNDWSLFRPRNNLFWLHYTLDKMLKMVRYKYKNTQVHKKSMKELKILESVILDFDDSSDFVINQGLI